MSNQTDSDNLQDLIHTLYMVELNFKLMHFQINEYERNCFLWDFRAFYDFSIRGSTTLSFEMSPGQCPQDVDASWWEGPLSWIYPLYWLNLLLAGILQILLLRSLRKSVLMFQLVKRHNSVHNTHTTHQNLSLSHANISQHSMSGDFSDPFDPNNPNNPAKKKPKFITTWESLSFSDKMKFFNFWFVSGSVSCMCVMIGSIMALHAFYDDMQIHSVYLSLYIYIYMCMCMFVSLIHTHRHTHGSLSLSLSLSSTRTCK